MIRLGNLGCNLLLPTPVREERELNISFFGFSLMKVKGGRDSCQFGCSGSGKARKKEK